MLRLSSIPGVGEKTAEKLVAHFGSEEEAVRALLEGRVSEVAEAVGSPRRALRLVQAAQAASLGVDPGEVFGTAEARRLFEEYLAAASRWVKSRPARDKLSSYFPLPARAVGALEARLQLIRLGLELLRKLGDAAERLHEALAPLEWLRRPRVEVERIVAVPAGFEGEAPPHARLVEVSSEADALKLVEEYGLALAYGVPAAEELGLIPVDELTLEAVAPEAVLQWVAVNRGTLRALAEAAGAVGVEELASALARLGGVSSGEVVEAAKLAAEALELVGEDGSPRAELSGEYARLKRAVEELERVAVDVAAWAHGEARRRLEALELRMSAAQLLRLLRGLAEGEVGVPEEVVEAVEGVAEEAAEKLISELGLRGGEAELAREVFKADPVELVRVDEEALRELRELLARKLAVEEYRVAARIAAKLKKLVHLIPKVHQALVELDLALGLARFAEAYGGSVAEVTTEYLGVAFEDAVELSLAEEWRRGGSVQRVSYVVGETPYRPEGTRGERVVLLTGANSGGKTTLLKTIAEVTLAAQAGLPVLARRAWVGAVDRVYFFTKPSGTVGAGALEEVLRKIAAVATEDARRLVLVDELESVTEARAAAAMVAVLAKKLLESRKAVAVIVSHLAEDVLHHLERMGVVGGVRVDGIEARGLDENYNLIVDRSPRYNYLARSTPELVAAKLYHTRRGEEKHFYKELLEAFKAARARAQAAEVSQLQREQQPQRQPQPQP